MNDPPNIATPSAWAGLTAEHERLLRERDEIAAKHERAEATARRANAASMRQYHALKDTDAAIARVEEAMRALEGEPIPTILQEAS